MEMENVSLFEEVPVVSAEAWKLREDFCNALLLLNPGYDTSLVLAEHVTTKSGDYERLALQPDKAKNPVSIFKIRGKQKRYVSFLSGVQSIFDKHGILYEKASGEAKVALKDFPDLTTIPEVAQEIYEDVIAKNGFGCCSRYEACSDAKHCVHPDVMFAAQCAYRKNLTNGRIFYGKNKTI